MRLREAQQAAELRRVEARLALHKITEQAHRDMGLSYRDVEAAQKAFDIADAVTTALHRVTHV